MSDLQPGDRVRVVTGRRAGTEGRIVRVHAMPQPVGHPLRYAEVDAGTREPILVYLSELEVVDAR